jgi:hypothetical protein
VTTEELKTLRDGVVAAAASAGFPRPLESRRSVAEIDTKLARALWEASGLMPAEAAVPDVWSFLALVLLPDVVVWRAQGSTNRERFVGSDLTRHTLGRLWWRAHLFTWGVDDPAEGWRLWDETQIGEADLDQLQTRRGGFGKSPKAFRALVRSYPVFENLASTRTETRRELWRTTYLRWLLRLGAFIDLNSLPEGALNEDLAAFVQELFEYESLANGTAAEILSPEGLSAGAPDHGAKFETMPLKDVVVRLAEAVRAAGSVPDAQLPDTLEKLSGLQLQRPWQDLIGGFAWQAKALGYLEHDQTRGVWSPGRVLPAPDRRWGEWTINGIVERVRANGHVEPEEVTELVFSGRAGRTVKRLVRQAFKNART